MQYSGGGGGSSDDYGGDGGTNGRWQLRSILYSQSYRLRFPVTCRMFAHRSGYNGFGAEGTGGPGSGVDVEQATIYEVTIR